MGAAAQKLDQGRIFFERTNESTLVAHLSGPWHLQRDLPPISLLLTELSSRPGTKRPAYALGQRADLISDERGRDLPRPRYHGGPRRTAGGSQAPARTGRGGSGEEGRA